MKTVATLCVLIAVALAPSTLATDCGHLCQQQLVVEHPVVLKQQAVVQKVVRHPHAVQRVIARKHHVSKAVAAIHAPYDVAVAHLPALYFVGQPIRVEAVVAKHLEQDDDWREFQEFKRWKATRDNQALSPARRDRPTPIPRPAAPLRSVISTSCVRCHSGNNPRGDLDLTLTLTEGQKARIVAMVHRGEMPIDGAGTPIPLSTEQKRILLDELFLQEE